MTVAALAVAAFWLLLALPGYALLRRYGRPWLAGGPLSAFATSCLASFALFTPVSVAGYALRLPLWVLTASLVLAVVAAVVQLARTVQWSLPSTRPSLLALVAGTVILVDAFMGLRIGSHLEGDALHHAGRVRMLLSYGFNSLDPLVEGRIDSVYLANLYHALIAASAQVSALPATEAWAYALFWAKLAAAGGVQFLAFAVLRDRRLGWIAAAIFAVYHAPYSVLVYPNTLAVFALLPLALGFAVQMQLDESRRHAIAGLGAVALVSAQVHSLYFAFACMLVMPPLLVALISTHLRRAPGRRELALALLALTLGLPWLGASAASRAAVRPEQPANAVAVRAAPSPPFDTVATAPAGTPKAEAERYRGFVRLPAGQIMSDPAKLWQPLGMELQLLLALGLGLFTHRRAAIVAVSGSVLVLLAALYIPPLCTLLVHLAGAPWVIRRLSGVFDVFWFAVVPGTLLLWIRERFAAHWIDLPALALSLAYAYWQGVDAEPWTRDSYVASIVDPAALRERLEQDAERRALFSAIPRGATVLTRPSDAARLALDCDCYPLAFAAARGSRDLPDIAMRRVVAEYLLDTQLDLPRRLFLLRQYGVSAIWLRGGHARKLAKLYRPIVARERKSGRNSVLVLDLSREF